MTRTTAFYVGDWRRHRSVSRDCKNKPIQYVIVCVAAAAATEAAAAPMKRPLMEDEP